MRLNTPLVTSFTYNNQEYDIDLTFDNVLNVFDYINNNEYRDHEKARICLALLLKKDIDYIYAIDMWNYIYEKFIKIERKQPIEYDRKGNPMPVQDDDDDEQFIDLEQDAEYIYSSFRQAYNINIYDEQGKMHWLEFQSLLSGLPSDTMMQRIIQIRTWKPTKGDSAEYKENMRKLQLVYALGGGRINGRRYNQNSNRS